MSESSRTKSRWLSLLAEDQERAVGCYRARPEPMTLHVAKSIESSTRCRCRFTSWFASRVVELCLVVEFESESVHVPVHRRLRGHDF